MCLYLYAEIKGVSHLYVFIYTGYNWNTQSIPLASVRAFKAAFFLWLIFS